MSKVGNNPIYSSNKVGEVLGKLAKAFLAEGAGALKMQHFKKTLIDDDIDDGDVLTFTPEDEVEVYGGYVEVVGLMEGDTLNMKVGKTGDDDALNASITEDGLHAIAPIAIADTEEILATITSLSAKNKVYLDIVLLTAKTDIDGSEAA